MSQRETKPTEREVTYLALWQKWQQRHGEEDEAATVSALEGMNDLRSLVIDYCESYGSAVPSEDSPYCYMFYGFCKGIDTILETLDGQTPEEKELLPEAQGEGALS